MLFFINLALVHTTNKNDKEGRKARTKDIEEVIMLYIGPWGDTGLSVSLNLSISILIFFNFRRIPTGASLLNYSQSLPEVIVLKGRRSVFFLPGSDLVLNLDQKYDMIYIYI